MPSVHALLLPARGSGDSGWDPEIEEEEKRFSQVDQQRLPSYRIGLQQGLQQGREQGLQQGESVLLLRQLRKRFGPVPDWVEERIAQAHEEERLRWAEAIFEASTLEELFQEPGDSA